MPDQEVFRISLPGISGARGRPAAAFRCYAFSMAVAGNAEARTSGDVTVLLQQISAGDSDAADRLIPLVLAELRSLARSYLRSERPGHTLQPTALVNEAYIRLVGDQARDWRNRAHFVGVTASIMRRILVDHARRRHAAKRNAGPPALEVAEWHNPIETDEDAKLLALNDALNRLEKLSTRQRRVVEMRHFGGLSVEDTAEALGVSTVTVKRDWLAARAWLKTQLQAGYEPGKG